MSQSHRPTAALVCSSATARFAATVDLPTPPLPLAIAITCLIPAILVAPTPAPASPRPPPPGPAAPRRRGLNIDPHLRFTHTSEIAQRVFRFDLDRPGNRRAVRGQRQLHDDVALMRLDALDQAERNNVTAEARIFHRLKRFLNLILGDSHFEPGSYRACCRSKDSPPEGRVCDLLFGLRCVESNSAVVNARS